MCRSIVTHLDSRSTGFLQIWALPDIRQTRELASVHPIVRPRKRLLFCPRPVRDCPLRCLLGGESRGRRLVVGLHDGVGRLHERLCVPSGQHIAAEPEPAHQAADLERTGKTGERQNLVAQGGAMGVGQRSKLRWQTQPMSGLSLRQWEVGGHLKPLFADVRYFKDAVCDALV